MINTHAQPAAFTRNIIETFNEFRDRTKLINIVFMDADSGASNQVIKSSIGVVIDDEEMERVTRAINRAPKNAKTQTLEDLAPTILATNNGDPVEGIAFSTLRRHYNIYEKGLKNE